MNYLAHLTLAQTNSHSLTGNLMGDFMKGVDSTKLPVAVQNGIENHRAVDKFTDHHAELLALKPLFSQRYRRFSGIMLDVSFDYFLTKHWRRFHHQSLHAFSAHCYQGLLAGRKHMPSRMQQTVEHMSRENWLSGYDDFERVGYALDRIAGRIRFRNDFTGSGSELAQHYAAIEQVFLAFYPALQRHITAQALEE